MLNLIEDALGIIHKRLASFEAVFFLNSLTYSTKLLGDFLVGVVALLFLLRAHPVVEQAATFFRSIATVRLGHDVRYRQVFQEQL